MRQRRGASTTALAPYANRQDSHDSSAMAIVRELREAILSLEDGDPIGSEDDLVERFDVSRPTVRQAARILQAEGLLTVRRGTKGGMFASHPSVSSVARSASLVLRHRHATFEQVLDAIVPLSNAMLAGAAAAPARARQQALEAVLAVEPSPELDEREKTLASAEVFGEQMYRLVDNPVIPFVLEMLVELVTGHRVEGPPDEGVSYDDSRRFHCAVATAVRDGDADEVARLTWTMREQMLAWMR